MNRIAKPEFNNKHNKAYDTEDGMKWDSRACAVVAHIWCQIENEEGHIDTYILVGKRGTGGDNIGKLNIPCGYMDWNENLRDATRRELYEETGFILEDYYEKAAIVALDQPWYVNTEPSENRQNIVLHSAFVFCLSAKRNEELPILSLENMEEDEVESVEWMNLDVALNKTKSEDWAFNHKERIEHFFNLLVKEKKED